MNSDLRVTKPLEISRVVISSENIREIARIVQQAYDNDMKQNQNPSVEYILKSDDNTQYQSSDSNIFAETGILDTRRIVSIEMNYHCEERRIWIDLNHTTSSYSSNKITISGGDEMWVNGVIKSLESALSNWDRQRDWPHRFEWPLILILIIGTWWMVFSLAKLLPSKTAMDENLYLVIFPFSVGFSYVALRIVERIRNLYPYVEFKMGPTHLRVEEKRRNKLYVFLTIIVLPFIISSILYAMDRFVFR